MSLQLILGRSGSGKTTELYSRVIQASMASPETNYFVLVPEQFAMETQKQIVSLHPRHGTMNIDILSFRRLAHRIFEETAAQHPAVLDDMGKSMVLRRAASRCRSQLSVYGAHLNRPGFIGRLKSMLSEFYQYGVGPEQLEAVRQTASPLLGEKLKDLEVLYQAFRQETEERYITDEELLDVLCRVLPRSERIRSSVIALDGYTGFTPVQYRLLEQMMRCARQVIVTISLDPAQSPYENREIQNLFYMGKQMYGKLEQLARETGTEKKKDLVLEENPLPRFQDSPALGELERCLYRYERTSAVPAAGQIRLLQAANPAEEAAAAASLIHQLVQEEGVRYREIAVLAGDLPSCRSEIVSRFRAEGIPCFLDDKRSILENAMVEFIRSALEMVRRDFDYESTFRFLKTGLASEDPEETDRMENYVLAMGIRGFHRWDSQWERTYRGGGGLNLDRLNGLREQLTVPMGRLRAALREKERTAASMTEALKQCLADWNVAEQLKVLPEELEAAGEYSLADEYGQVWDRVMELFDRVEELLGEETVSLKEYEEILDAGFEEIQVGVIPATVDRVVVGDLTRTRLGRIQVLLFLGVNEGSVPSRKEGGSLLTDLERQAFQKQGVELAPTAREDGFLQRYYLYLMLARPSRMLALSCVSFDQAGKTRRPSSLFSEIRRIFPDLGMEEAGRVPGRIGSRQEGKERLIQGLREWREGEETAEFLEVYRRFSSDPESAALLKALREAAFYSGQEKGIGRAAARALYGTTLQGSVTRLEQFASCACAHFLRYGLELMERQEYEVGAADMGNLFHGAIDACFETLRQQNRQLTELTEEERRRLVQTCVEQVTDAYTSTVFQSSARNRYLITRISRMTDRTMWALAKQLERGDFVPAGFEVSFSAIDNLKAMKIRLSEDERLWLQGRIDRLDQCEDGPNVYIKIIDYKSGSAGFDLAAVYYGLQLQLVVYLDAVMELKEREFPGRNVVPAGIFYYNIKDPVADREEVREPEDVEREILKQLRMSGLVNRDPEAVRHLDREIRQKSDVIPVSVKDGELVARYSSAASSRQFEILREYVRTAMKNGGIRILSGDTRPQPYKNGSRSACDYCPYHSVCGFDSRIAGYRYRRFAPLKPEEVWERMGGGEENGEETGKTRGEEDRQ